MNSSESRVKVDPALISEADYEIGCRVLSSAVRLYFSRPGVREEYEAWLKTEEGQLSDLSPKERKKRLEAAKKEQKNETRKKLTGACD